MDRLVKMLGGEENLPSKLANAASTPTIEVTEPADNHNEEQSTERQENDDPADNWWDAEPQPEPTPLSSGHAAAPAAPYSSNGNSDYEIDPRRGQPAPLGLNYCPFVAVTRYCYKFVKR